MLRKYFGSASFYRQALCIALPVMGQSLIQNLVSLIDNFMVAGLGDVKMSGVNIAGQILFVFMVLLNTVCTAGGIFMTQFFGAKDGRGMRQSLCFKIVVSGAALVIYLAVCMLFPRSVLRLLVIGNAEADAILDVGVRYISLMGYIGLPIVMSGIMASSLREVGEVKAPLVISVAATIINTFLNWVLIYGNLGAPRLEVTGAAYATIIARCAETLMYFMFLRRFRQPFAIRPDDLAHIDWKLFRTILKRGSMMIFSEMVWVVSETVTTALYNSRGGADVVSGMSASFAIANLFFVAFTGITTATGIIVGKSLGAGRLDEARAEARWLLTASIFFGAVMTVLGLAAMLLVPVVFASLSAASQSICASMVFWMAIFMPVWVYQNAQFAISRAGGDTMMGMLVDVICTIGIATPLMFYLALGTGVGPVAIYISIKLVDFAKVLIAWLWLRKERWVKNLASVQG